MDEHSETNETDQKSEFKSNTFWGDEPKPSPATACTNLIGNEGWPEGAVILPTNEDSTSKIGQNDTLRPKKEERVSLSEEEKTVEEQSDDDAIDGASGQIKIMADATDETDSKPLKNTRLANDRLKDDASTICLEVSEEESQTDDAIRSLRTAHSDGWLSNENPNEVIYNVVKVVNDKTATDKEMKADAKEPDQDLNDLESTDMKIVDMDGENTIKNMQYNGKIRSE